MAQVPTTFPSKASQVKVVKVLEFRLPKFSTSGCQAKVPTRPKSSQSKGFQVNVPKRKVPKVPKYRLPGRDSYKVQKVPK